MFQMFFSHIDSSLELYMTEAFQSSHSPAHLITCYPPPPTRTHVSVIQSLRCHIIFNIIVLMISFRYKPTPPQTPSTACTSISTRPPSPPIFPCPRENRTPSLFQTRKSRRSIRGNGAPARRIWGFTTLYICSVAVPQEYI